jgi:hypothetical protein
MSNRNRTNGGESDTKPILSDDAAILRRSLTAGKLAHASLRLSAQSGQRNKSQKLASDGNLLWLSRKAL